MMERGALDAALRELTGAGEDRRIEALKTLLGHAGRTGAEMEPLVAALPGVLADGSSRVRRLGLLLASRLLSEDELAPLARRFVTDAEAAVRVEAVGLLGELARPEARGALAAALEDDDAEVRFEAACGMAALRHPAGMEILVEALDVAAWRFRALGSLALLEDARALEPVQALARRFFLSAFDRTQAMGVAARLGDGTAGAYLFGRTRKRWSPDRAYALELLGELKLPGARERLLEVLADEKDKCRGAAARSLGRLRAEDAGERLQALLVDAKQPEGLRLDAAEGLLLLGEPRWREVVAGAVSAFPGEEAREELQALLEDAA
jgi:HEAT repeat protein